MRNVTDRLSNPFGMRPSCDRFVPGFGDANAVFHVVGDHPGVHGHAQAEDGTLVPFSNEAGLRLQDALVDAGLLREAGVPPTVESTFLSYLHGCHVEGTPSDRSYGDMERFFDAELRAIAAHVLVPVGKRATSHVLANYTAHPASDPDMDRLHGRELHGSGWLVVPASEPAGWSGDDADRFVAGLRELQRTDFRRESDLGRFFPGDESYLVR